MDPLRLAAERLLTLFAGYPDAYGTHGGTHANAAKGGKLEIKATASTIRAKVTVDLWVKHLLGDAPIGIIPTLADATCWWGCIDVDNYHDLSHAALVEAIEKEGLPLVVCRSKSGGAHLFLFASDPVSTEVMIRRLKEISTRLGLGGSEIFPKSVRMLLERGDLGQWLNMPYFDGDQTDRYAVRRGGAAMGTMEFIEYSEKRRQTPDQILNAKFAKKAKDKGPTMEHGPPCLQHLSASAFPEGTRNKGLFMLGVFAKKKYTSTWKRVIEEMNQSYITPPLLSDEVQQIIRQLERKEYQYTCQEFPFSNHCDASLCRTRKYGVGSDEDFPVISGLSVLNVDPPLWFVDVDNQRIELSTEQLQSYAAFHRLCMEKLHVCYRMMKQETWLNIVSSAMKNVTKVETPKEVSAIGILQEYLEEFCLNRHRGRVKDDILLGKPWEDETEQKHYFRLADLTKFLENENFKGLTRGQLTERLRSLGGGNHFFNIKGKGVNVWWIPSMFQAQGKSELPPITEPPV